jgi:hypothetical protein
LPDWIPAARFAPADTNGAQANSRDVGGIRVLDSWDFVAGADRTVTVSIAKPSIWAGSTVAMRFQWSTGSGTSGQLVRWQGAGRFLSDGDSESVAYGTAQVVDDAIGAIDTIRDSDATPAITVDGTNGTSRVVTFRFRRLGSADTAPGFARLLGVYIEWL